jgi:hypothetical protein
MAPAEAQRKAEQVADAMVEMAAEIKQDDLPRGASLLPWIVWLPFRIVFGALGVLWLALAKLLSARRTAPAEEAIEIAEAVEEPVHAEPVATKPPPSRPRIDLRQLGEVAEQPAARPRHRDGVGEKLAALVLGGHVRLGIGALLFCVALAGLHATGIADDLRDSSIWEHGTWENVWRKLSQAEGLQLGPLPALSPMASLAAGVAGCLLAFSAFQPIRWLALLHYAAAAFIIAGPQLGVPAIEPLSPELVSISGGVLVSLFVMVLTRIRQG